MLRISRFTRALIARTSAEALVELQKTAASLDDALDGLERFGTLHADVAEQALRVVVQRDLDDAATAAIAARRELLFATAKAHAMPLFIREATCRSIANMAMLPDPEVADEDHRNSTAGVVTLASSLAAKNNAVNVALSVLERGADLSPKGRAWAANALLNLCIYDDAAARSAAAANADVAAAHAVRDLLQRGTRTCAVDSAAIDAAMGLIPRLLSLQEGDNADTAHRYQHVSVVVIDAAVDAIATPWGTTSVTHKAWEALRLIASHEPNHPLIFAALHKADHTSGMKILGRWMEDARAALNTYQPSCDDSEMMGEQSLKRQVLLSGLETLTALTSARDTPADGRASTSAAVEGGGQGECDEALIDDDSHASPHVTAVAALSSGHVAKFLVSLLSSYRDEVLMPPSTEFDKGRDDSVVVGCVTLLGNLADTDPFVVSANCVASLRPYLGERRRAISTVALDRVLTVIWNVMNHKAGAEAVAVLSLGNELQGICADTTAAPSSRTGAERLLKKIDAIVNKPRYAYDTASSGSSPTA